MNMLIPTAVATPGNTNNVVKSSPKGSTNAAKAGESFGQVLGQSLNGQSVTNGSAQEAPALTLQGIVKNFLDGETSGENTLDQLIAQLIASLQESDDKLAGNEDLLQQLQAWLAQASALIQSIQSNQGEIANTESLVTTTTDLTLHPGTIRFTVQDKLMQLLALVKDGNEGMTLDMSQFVTGQGKVQTEFIQSLQAALNEVSVETAVPQTVVSTTPNAQVGQMILALQHILNQANASKPGDQGQMLEVDVNAPSGVQVTDGLKQAVSDRSGMLQQQMSNNTQSESDETEVAQSTVNTTTTDDVPDVFTAGQMAMRTQDTPLIKSTPTMVSAQNFAPEMSNFIKHLDITTKLNGISEAKIILFPEHLGQVDIRISIQNGQLMAHFMTEHGQAKDMLDHQMGQLRAALQAQGLQVEKLEVTQNESLHSQMYHEQRQPNSQQHQSEQQNKNRITGKEDQSLSGMISDQEPNIRVRGLGYGSSFTASV